MLLCEGSGDGSTSILWCLWCFYILTTIVNLCGVSLTAVSCESEMLGPD